MTLNISEKDEACPFRVRVSSRGRRSEIIGKHGHALKLRMQVLPVEGRARRALGELLAEQLAISCRDVQIVSGHTSR